jgi:hypothetical protein
VCELAITIESFTLKFVNLCVIFLTLLFKIFELLFEGGVATSFQGLCTLSGFPNLSFKGFTELVLQAKFMLDLGYIGLVALLSLTKLILETFDFFISFLGFLSHPLL